MTWVLLALGLVLAAEGLAFALAPSRIEEALRALAAMSQDQRRMLGLVMLAAGVLLIWIARGFMA
ncbi:MAG: hypothetical protein RLZZ437_2576 [Pseudomonadota bacterium]|jgi:uncharacterized protein